MKVSWWLCACLLVVLATRLPYFGERLYNVDTAARAVQAWAWTQGMVPEHDTVVSSKTPGLAWLFLQCFRLFGLKLVPLQLLALLLVLITAGLVFMIGRLLDSPRAGALAAALYAGIVVFGYAPAQWLEPHTEYPEMVCLTAAVLMAGLFVVRRQSAWAFLGGFLLACAVMMRQNALVLGFYLFIALGLGLCKDQRRRLPLAFALGLAGMVFGFAPWLVYYWRQDALGGVWLQSFVLTQHYSAGLSAKAMLLNLPLHLGKYLRRQLVPAVFALWFLFSKKNRKADFSYQLVATMFLGAVTAASLGGRYSPHYYLQLAPFLALAAGMGASRWYSILASQPKKSRLIPLACALYLMVGVVLISRPALRSYFCTGSTTARLNAPGEPTNAREVGVYLQSHTRPGERIAVIGRGPAVYWFAERLPALTDIWGARVSGYFGWNDAPEVFQAYEPGFVAELMERKPPVLVEFCQNGLFSRRYSASPGKLTLEKLPLLFDALKKHYVETPFGGSDTVLWWRKDLSPGGVLAR